MIDIEIGLATALNWSLYDIDRTAIESLIPFVQRLSRGNEPKKRRVYVDEINL
jgi:hypothetical protein